MDSAQIIYKYFPHLSELQKKQIDEMGKIYADWNVRINLISRKDITNFYERHVLHSLGIAKIISFKPKTKILDVGTGGGFPGIPLSILFPECEFCLIDSIGKKIKIVNAVIKSLGLKNVKADQIRIGRSPMAPLSYGRGVGGEAFHFITGRAVTELFEFCKWGKGKFLSENFNDLPNGILYMKGGENQLKIRNEKLRVKEFDLRNYFEENFFETKKVVHLSC